MLDYIVKNAATLKGQRQWIMGKSKFVDTRKDLWDTFLTAVAMYVAETRESFSLKEACGGKGFLLFPLLMMYGTHPRKMSLVFPSSFMMR